MIFSVGLQFQNNDIHKFNINALSFDHANKKIDEYCHNYGRENLSSDYYYKKAQIACNNGSSYFSSNLPVVKISTKKINGNAIITKHKTEKYNIL